jgi:hypothetical protein
MAWQLIQETTALFQPQSNGLDGHVSRIYEKAGRCAAFDRSQPVSG